MSNIEKIAINGYYVWVDKDAEIKEGDWYKSPAGIYSQHNGTEKLPDGWCKIIAASPELNLEGVPTYVEYLAEQEYEEARCNGTEYASGAYSGFIKGYQTAEKELFTENEVRKAFCAGMKFIGEDKGSWGEFIEQLKKEKNEL